MQLRRLRSLRLAAVAAVVTLTVAACGGSSGGGTTGGGATTAGGGSGGDLLIWTGGGPIGEETKKLGAAFGKENGVNVTVQIVAKDLQTQFVTASQAGKAPDVVMGAHDWIGNLVQNGTIDPVQMTDETKAGFEDLAVKAVTFNGQIYGVPFTKNNIVLFRNTDLVPDAPATFEDLVAKGKELKAAGKVSEIVAYPIGPNGDPYHINPLYTSGGGYMFGTLPNGDYNPKDLGVGKPASIDAYKKISALGEKGEGVLKRSITTDNILSLFTGKKTAFMVSGPWQFADLNKSSVKYDVSPVPGFAGGKPAQPFITVDAAYVASKGKNKALGQEFVTNYWSRPDVALALFKANPNVPALKATVEQIKTTDPQVAKVAEAGTKDGQIMPSIPAMAAVWDPLGKAEAAVVGGADPTSTITAAGKTISAQIK
jgi:arabinogalactan oligomer/maltooligosaccharide transport system substrate-binding protein